MTTYLQSFRLPIEEEESLITKRMAENGGAYGYIDNAYPCGLFGSKGLYEVHFRDITIFYGGNGSGKSTLLNLIATKVGLNRIAPCNSSELFDAYVKKCSYTMGYDEEGVHFRIPNESRIITSDDVFDYMLAVRTNNADIREETERGKDKYRTLKYGETIKFNGMEDYEDFRMMVLARTKSLSRRQFLRRALVSLPHLGSRGLSLMMKMDCIRV